MQCKPSIYQIVNFVTFALNIFITYAGGVASIFGGKTNSEISDQYTSIVTPASYAFSIWGIIFVAEGIFVIWQIFPAQKSSPVLSAIGYWWSAANILQAVWTFAFAYEVLWLAFAFIFGITVCLAMVYLALHHPVEDICDNETAVPLVACSIAKVGSLTPLTVGTTKCGGILRYWVSLFGFSVHLGWIIAATLININLASIDSGADDAAQQGVAIGSLATLAIVAAVLAWPRMDPAVGGVAAWALLAIGRELWNSDGRMQQGSGNYREFGTDLLRDYATTAFVLAAIHAAVAVGLLVRNAVVVARMPDVQPAAQGDEREAVEIITSPHSKDECDKHVATV